MKPVIALTIGDFNGVGPELALKAALNHLVLKSCTPLLVGPLRVFEHSARQFKMKLKFERATLATLQHLPPHTIPIVDVGDGIGADIQYGIPTKASGRSAGIALERAVELCLQNKVAAMVTAPVSKEALNSAGFNFPGQTEMIALLTRSQSVAMMLISDTMRVGLVTIHTGLKNVAAQISKEKIIEKIAIIDDSLKKDFRLKKPKLAILALNPHCGENGLIGTEENEIIIPAIAESQAAGICAEGPFPADAFFGNRSYENFEAFVAMYHDQGLIPLKMSSFGKGVNFSAGLKIIRTSPDHGTAYDIAGKNKATLSSMLEAIKLALTISKNRRKYD
ncbi:MAG: 4-hydroxythreonine-4-phosphate dehydrogenase PdxA [Ignavibacteriales bacterium]|nr:4-hydroxythreonine-4-phosphate dehydrogenase PdxA [Ignavibacteriales bacterium]